MSVLCDWEIKARCQKSHMIQPFDPSMVNPASIDVRLGSYLMVESIYSPELVRINISDKTEDDPFMLQPGEFCLAETVELFNIPDDISCEFKLKSSRAREGFQHALAAWIDPGFNSSRLTLELKNLRLHHALGLHPGKRIGQVIFHEMSNVPLRSYRETGHYNNHLTVMPSVA
jgi:dCTP deaminase